MQPPTSTLLSRLDLLEQRLHETHSRTCELEKVNAQLRSDNEILLSFQRTLLNTFAHAEDVIVDLVGRMDALEKLGIGNGRSDAVDKLAARVEVQEKPLLSQAELSRGVFGGLEDSDGSDMSVGSSESDQSNVPDVLGMPDVSRDGRFIDRSDPLGLRKLGGLPPRDGYKSQWTWMPVRILCQFF